MSSYCVEAFEIVASRPSGVTQQPTSRSDERSDPCRLERKLRPKPYGSSVKREDVPRETTVAARLPAVAALTRLRAARCVGHNGSSAIQFHAAACVHDRAQLLARALNTAFHP
jgi:hypothetical protein